MVSALKRDGEDEVRCCCYDQPFRRGFGFGFAGTSVAFAGMAVLLLACRAGAGLSSFDPPRRAARARAAFSFAFLGGALRVGVWAGLDLFFGFGASRPSSS